MARGSRFKDPGCLRCKQRKIKCDMRRPFCKTCDARKETCPGYPSKIEFRDANTKLEKRLGLDPNSITKPLVTTPDSFCNSKHQVGGGSSSSSSSSSPWTSTSTLTLASAAPSMHAAVVKPLDIRYDPLMMTKKKKKKRFTSTQPQIMHAPMASDSAQLQLKLIRLMDPDLPHTVRLNVYGLSVLEHLPTHLGVNPALDAATQFLCHVHEVSIGAKEPRFMHSLKLQTTAINKLRLCIPDPSLSKAPETVAAAIIMASLESNTPGDSVPAIIKHAAGIRALIDAQDPPSPRSNDFDRAVIMSAQGAMWTHAVLQGEASVFDSKPYLTVVKEPPPTNHSFQARADIAHSLLYTIVPFPRLLRDVKRWWSASTGAPATAAAAAAAVIVDASNKDNNCTAQRYDIIYRCHSARAWISRPSQALTYFQTEIRKALEDPNFTPQSPLYSNPEFSAYASILATIMMLSRRALALVQPETGHLIDHNSKLDAPTEIARMTNYLRRSHAAFVQSDPAALVYVTCTLQACLDAMHRIDGQGTFFHIMNPTQEPPVSLSSAIS